MKYCQQYFPIFEDAERKKQIEYRLVFWLKLNANDTMIS